MPPLYLAGPAVDEVVDQDDQHVHVAACGVDEMVAADPGQVAAVRAAITAPVWVGSGVNAANIADFWPASDGLIVGSSLKEGGIWSADLDPQRLDAFAQRLRAMRG